MEIYTPIKVNLALHVVGQQSDGYHSLESLVYFSLDGDKITYAPSNHDVVSVSGSYAKNLKNNQHNLIVKARECLTAYFPNYYRPSFLKLEKNLPLSSGLGGGSGDAAGVMQLLRHAWCLKASDKIWSELALSLGADVPMCLSALTTGKSLIAKGVGEELTLLNEACPLWLVLVNHGEEIPTAEIFKRLKNKNNTPLNLDISCLKHVDSLVEALKKTRNDLYEPARSVAPKLEDVLTLLDQTGSKLSRMSGSGATCFGIFGDKRAACASASKIKEKHPTWFVKTIKTLGTI
ncbi:4-(cytidine 5'-diphospho)-2-C-methyl-D-erythritol kinase [Bartonella tamiae]|uniref:4-diphosphocytidyl-2-C-methyl-D-erythritol kinase n=1 Tax=Bartonella tamiae Th239 TaxID=1094558 RepID=J0R4D1_9HYPH|nr:4-(cytidine 5'-diphospho)-2-C-methyl-D-erythritol kinase [Bartonella tamiae]EJF90504.1 4-(cytidine 5'-diphospho)-2-C-methyl-D-erythritol kinase [Bartonella tamiae Th239]EJF93552.1 4-(cytidine 5'-diphospho)-2-C-methyl-D-erythritol kinase [Bartonella tamiae Th307]